MDPDSLVLQISSDEDVDVVGDDCVVLDHNPTEHVDAPNHNHSNDDDDDDDVLVVSEKGQVACRDYPHSRHLCIKFPFATTPNQSHCNLCFCYVCDSPAPCVFWGDGAATTDHCHATDKDEVWILQRKNAKSGCKGVQPVTQLPPVAVHILAPPVAQIPNPGLIHAQHTLASVRYNIRALRTKLHPDLASQSQLVLRAHQRHNLGSRVRRAVFKRTGAATVAETANHNPCRDIFGNLNMQQSSQVSIRLSRARKSLASLQNPIDTSLMVNPQPLLQQPQVANHSNQSFPSHVNSNLLSKRTKIRRDHQQDQVPPLLVRSQPESGQPSCSFRSKTRVNPQPLLQKHQVASHSNPSFPSHVKSNLSSKTKFNPSSKTRLYHKQDSVQPLPVRPQPESGQPSSVSSKRRVNPQPLLKQPQVANHSNPSLPSHVKSKPLSKTTLYHQQDRVPPLLVRPQPESGEPSCSVRSKKRVNPQPLLQQPQVANHSNPSFPSHVKSNPLSKTRHYHQQDPVPPLLVRSQLASGQPSYPVPSRRTESRLVNPVSHFTHHSSQGNQAQGPVADSSLKDSYPTPVANV